MGTLFFNVVGTSAEFEVDPLRIRTCEGTAAASAKDRLESEPPTRVVFITPRSLLA